MNALQQLQEQAHKISVSRSMHDVLYDWCGDYHFMFDVEIVRKWTHDKGTAFAPERWESDHTVNIYRLRVLKNYEPVQVDNEGEIIKELLTKIEID